MRVFISWSGEPSRRLAEAFRKWLPSVLQYVKPYFTPSDIDKGARWSTEISKELKSSSACIIVLTRENLNSNWIMFEAGAISSTLEQARVCPIVFGVEPTDIQGPLAQFQATKFTKADIRQLFDTINSAAGEARLAEPVASSVFDKWWPDLESEVTEILKSIKPQAKAPDVRSERDLLEETLLLARTAATAQQEISDQIRNVAMYLGHLPSYSGLGTGAVQPFLPIANSADSYYQPLFGAPTDILNTGSGLIDPYEFVPKPDGSFELRPKVTPDKKTSNKKR